MNLLEGLNKQQLEAVTTCDTHVRIIAGAGSGKTRVVTTRIAYLIEELGVMPYRILAITFTNKAAKEMKERVNNILGLEETGTFISTIHSFCVRVLREDIESLGYSRNFVILDSDDQKSILRDIYKKLNIDIKTISYSQALGYISNNKSALITPKQAEEMAFMELDKIKAQIYKLYIEELEEMKSLDFDDLLIFVYRLFKTNKLVLEKWQNRFDFIHVDEFQDVDELQYSIIRYLAGDKALLCVVGDPDQTIYTWRGASVKIIMDFDKDFKGAKSIILNQNYRSTKSILAAANNIIKNNNNRLKKDLFTENTNDELITYYASNDEKFEAAWIAEQIKKMHSNNISYKDIAILYRSNYLSRGLEKAMLDANIPYRIYGGVKFFERAEVKDALSYLRLLVKDNDSYANLAIKRVLNTPKRGIGPKTMDNIVSRSIYTGMNQYEVLKNPDIASGKAKAKIDEFVNMIEKSRDKLAEGYAVSLILDDMLTESGYYKMLEENHETDRKENIEELIGDIQNYENNNPDGDLDDYLQTISLYTDSENSEDNSGDVVQLMSVHAAKGLEFDNVFIYSMCEGVFPNERSVSEGGNEALEEERRLAYVAFTRAKKKLHISSSMGYSYITNSNKTPSRFINEIGEELLDRKGENTVSSSYFSSSSVKENSYVSKINKTSMTSNNKQPASRKRVKLKSGDVVIHKKFQEGVVIKVEDNIATIAFDKKFGMRRISVNHPALKRK